MKNEKNIEFFAPELLAKYLTEEVTPDEKSEMDAWLNQSVENREELERVRKMLVSVDAFYKAESFNSVEALQKVKARMQSQQQKIVQQSSLRKEFVIRFYKYAAVVLFAVLLGSAGYFLGFRNKTPEIYSEVIAADKQIISEYTLPDGSVVALNSGSKLVFPKSFTGNTREVSITGEAFFNVKPDASKPFIINAGNAQVKVLGTSFNVRAFPENETVEVVVATGKVQVTSLNKGELNENNRLLLVPGEKGTLYNKNLMLEKSENTNLNYLSWKTHDFTFNETKLSDVFNCLEQIYHVHIEVVQPELNDLKLTAQFDKKSIEFILNVVRLTFDLELNEENEQFTFARRTGK